MVSKQRVADHGEVYTNPREVNAMLDLVKQETERIDSRFLEPACGTGNFLTEILRRKLAVVEGRYRRSRLEYERYAVLAVSSIYGIDILEDNVIEARRRLMELFDAEYTQLFPSEARDEVRAAARFILGRNIIWGDALTLRRVPTADGDGDEPIIFSEWSLIGRGRMVRRDFSFRELLGRPSMKELPLFADLGNETERAVPLYSDLGDDIFIPTPVREFPPVHFLRVGEAAAEDDNAEHD